MRMFLHLYLRNLLLLRKRRSLNLLRKKPRIVVVFQGMQKGRNVLRRRRKAVLVDYQEVALFYS
jgi:hypothetical protein